MHRPLVSHLPPAPSSPTTTSSDHADSTVRPDLRMSSSQDEHQRLRKAERSLLQGKHKDALHVTIQFFQQFLLSQNRDEKMGERKHSTSPSSNKIIRLPWPRHEENYTAHNVVVDCCNQKDERAISIADQMAAVAFQSWSEILRQQKQQERHRLLARDAPHPWEYLDPILKHYSHDINDHANSPFITMSLELFSLWIDLCWTHGRRVEAFLWTVQFLLQSSSSSQQLSKIDDVWVTCLTKRMVYLEDHSMAEQVAHQLLIALDGNDSVHNKASSSGSCDSDWASSDGIHNSAAAAVAAETLKSTVQPNTVVCLRALLTNRMVADNAAGTRKDLLQRCVKRLDKLSVPRNAINESIVRNKAPVPLPDNMRLSSINENQLLISRKCHMTIQRWIHWLSSTVAPWVKHVQSSALYCDEEQRSRILLSIALVVLGWSQKRRLRQLLRWMVLGALSPVTDVLEAWRKSSNSDGRGVALLTHE